MDIYRKTRDQATEDADKVLLERQMKELSELIDRTDIQDLGGQAPSPT